MYGTTSRHPGGRRVAQRFVHGGPIAGIDRALEQRVERPRVWLHAALGHAPARRAPARSPRTHLSRSACCTRAHAATSRRRRRSRWGWSAARRPPPNVRTRRQGVSGPLVGRAVAAAAARPRRRRARGGPPRTRRGRARGRASERAHRPRPRGRRRRAPPVLASRACVWVGGWGGVRRGGRCGAGWLLWSATSFHASDWCCEFFGVMMMAHIGASDRQPNGRHAARPPCLPGAAPPSRARGRPGLSIVVHITGRGGRRRVSRAS